MTGQPLAIRVAVLAMAANAGLGLWLEFAGPAGEAGIVAGIVVLAVVSLIAPIALIAFARHRLSGWGLAGIAAWLAGAAVAGFLAAWVVMFVSYSTSWTPGDHWFLADPVLQTSGQLLVLVALVQAQPAVAPPRPIRLYVIAIACGALGVTMILTQVGMLHASFEAMSLLRKLGELTRAGVLLLFAWGLVHVERELRAGTLPAARAYIAGGGGPT